MHHSYLLAFLVFSRTTSCSRDLCPALQEAREEQRVINFVVWVVCFEYPVMLTITVRNMICFCWCPAVAWVKKVKHCPWKGSSIVFRRGKWFLRFLFSSKSAMPFVFIKKNNSMSKHAGAQISVDYFFFFSFPWWKRRNLFGAFPSLIVFVNIIEGSRRQLNCSIT